MKNFGLIVVDKPVGPTSHQVVSLVRRGARIRKVGHAGTLDPRASGVLILCLGAATRLSEYLSTASKCYEALIRFGTSTDTYDADGAFVRSTGTAPSLEAIRDTLPDFRGSIDQLPPPYSAIKVKGTKAYELARQGREVELKARRVTIYRLEILSFESPDLSVLIDCSAGTYVRSLAHDLGERLSTGAHLAALRRTMAGPFSIDDAVPLAKLEVGFMTEKWEQYVRPAGDGLPDFPVVQVEESQLDLIRNGHSIPSEPGSHGLARALGPDAELVAILEAVEGEDLWHPRKVFLS